MWAWAGGGGRWVGAWGRWRVGGVDASAGDEAGLLQQHRLRGDVDGVGQPRSLRHGVAAVALRIRARAALHLCRNRSPAVGEERGVQSTHEPLSVAAKVHRRVRPPGLRRLGRRIRFVPLGGDLSPRRAIGLRIDAAVPDAPLPDVLVGLHLPLDMHEKEQAGAVDPLHEHGEGQPGRLVYVGAHEKEGSGNCVIGT